MGTYYLISHMEVKLMEVVTRGFPQNSYELHDAVKPFHKFRHDLHVADEVVCYKDRIVFPAQLREQLLETIHAAHQGVTGMMGRVEDTGVLAGWEGASLAHVIQPPLVLRMSFVM